MDQERRTSGVEIQMDVAEKIVQDFEHGVLSRRQLIPRLTELGAALAMMRSTVQADEEHESTFQATGLDHVALNVRDVPSSREFYAKHLGLKVLRDGGQEMCFLGRGETFFLALFRAEKSNVNHYCYTIQNYEPDKVVRKLTAAGLQPRREADRVYFDDPDKIEIQLTGR